MAVEDRYPGRIRVDGTKKFMNVGKAFVECELQLIFVGVNEEEAAALAQKFIDDHPNGLEIKILDDGDEDADAKLRFNNGRIESEHCEVEIQNEDAIE